MNPIGTWFLAVTAALTIPAVFLIRYMDDEIRKIRKRRKKRVWFYEGDET